MLSLFKIKMGAAPGLKRLAGHRVTDLFNNLDADNSKAIGKEELAKFLKLQKVDLSPDQIDSVMKQFGENGHLNEDGDIPYDTFVSVLSGRLS